MKNSDLKKLASLRLSIKDVRKKIGCYIGFTINVTNGYFVINTGDNIYWYHHASKGFGIVVDSSFEDASFTFLESSKEKMLEAIYRIKNHYKVPQQNIDKLP